mmetsp:Transcript_5747/g.18058  ORF Transcript_5747/g.18058 Transcript_5747/m.18058 type:complete len:206 (+) Transcript_5747:226-843(+)
MAPDVCSGSDAARSALPGSSAAGPSGSTDACTQFATCTQRVGAPASATVGTESSASPVARLTRTDEKCCASIRWKHLRRNARSVAECASASPPSEPPRPCALRSERATSATMATSATRSAKSEAFHVTVSVVRLPDPCPTATTTDAPTSILGTSSSPSSSSASAASPSSPLLSAAAGGGASPRAFFVPAIVGLIVPAAMSDERAK